MLPSRFLPQCAHDQQGRAIWPKKWLESKFPATDAPPRFVTAHSNGFVVWENSNLAYPKKYFRFKTMSFQLWRPTTRVALEQAIQWVKEQDPSKGDKDYRSWVDEIETIDDIIKSELL